MLKAAIPLLHVSNAAAAEDFYRNKLGFARQFAYRVDEARADPCFMGLARDGALLHASSFSGDGVAGGVVSFLVEDVDALYAELIARQVVVVLPPTDQSWGNREMYVRDADGNSLRFIRQGDGGAEGQAAPNSAATVNMPALYFLTGSSGSGKTTLLRGVMETIFPHLAAYFFDDIGVPSLEEMSRLHGGPEQWQAAATRQWIDRIARGPNQGMVVIEGQVRPSFVLEAAQAAGLATVHITLVDCSMPERRRRLQQERGQPELDTADMHAWSAYLRGQADALKLEVIDTTSQTTAEATAALARSIASFAAETGRDIASRH